MLFQTFFYDVVDSTNDVAKSLYESGKIQRFACVTAREQTRGKGTRGKSWLSPRDAGIYVTFVDATEHPIHSDTSILTLAAGVACADVLKTRFNMPIRLKPINDLYVDGRKLGGILTECVIQGNVVKAVFTGIGINVAIAARPLDVDSPAAASLEELLSYDEFAALSTNALIEQIGARLVELHSLVWNGEFATIHQRFENYTSVH